jgi:hypothetical protein
MSDRTQKIYEAMIDGAQAGLADDNLFKLVVKTCPKATSKKIVRASLLALSDPGVKDKKILETIYALAIKHRLEPISKDDLKEIKAAFQPEPKKKSARSGKKAGVETVQPPGSTQVSVGL